MGAKSLSPPPTASKPGTAYQWPARARGVPYIAGAHEHNIGVDGLTSVLVQKDFARSIARRPHEPFSRSWHAYQGLLSQASFVAQGKEADCEGRRTI
jgi:hypothetical protein